MNQKHGWSIARLGVKGNYSRDGLSSILFDRVLPEKYTAIITITGLSP
ncbi:MAG: hypothetical protein JXR86_17825 [Spirochaetales bacterium]|nr:hypothetical protein [Spirochaetales bacterium]